MQNSAWGRKKTAWSKTKRFSPTLTDSEVILEAPLREREQPSDEIVQ